MRRQVELVFVPTADGRYVDVPADATIVAVDFYDPAGMLQGRCPSGVWIQLPVRLYDEDHPERWPAAAQPLPPPEGTP